MRTRERCLRTRTMSCCLIDFRLRIRGFDRNCSLKSPTVRWKGFVLYGQGGRGFR